MSEVNKKRGLLKKVIDAKWGWDMIQGPIYNDLIEGAASEVYRELVAQINPPENTVVLDVGSGPGLATIMMARQYPSINITGIDYSMTEVNAANRKLAENQTTNCSFRQGNAMSIPFDDEHLDLVVSFASIKHWPDGVAGLREVMRVLKPDGSAFIMEANRESPEPDFLNFANRFVAWYTFRPFMKWFLRRVVFGASYTAEEAARMAAEAGFSKIETDKVTGWPFFTLNLKK